MVTKNKVKLGFIEFLFFISFFDTDSVHFELLY